MVGNQGPKSHTSLPTKLSKFVLSERITQIIAKVGFEAWRSDERRGKIHMQRCSVRCGWRADCVFREFLARQTAAGL